MNIVRYHFATIDSTNTSLKRNIEWIPDTGLAVVTAEEQAAGRGRLGRSWFSPRGYNLYVSFGFWAPANRIVNSGQLLAVSVVEILEQWGFEARIKWPNDVMLSNKKTGGILCETISFGEKTAVIAGIGLNVNMPAELLDQLGRPATSLSVEKPIRKYDLEESILLLQDRFSTNLSRYLHEGFTPFISYYRQKILTGNDLTFSHQGQQWKGAFHSLEDDGALYLCLDGGEIKRFNAGEII